MTSKKQISRVKPCKDYNEGERKWPQRLTLDGLLQY